MTMDDDSTRAGHEGRCGGQLKQPREDGRVTCDHPAGYDTPHPGFGRCKFHGGSTPSHVESARQEQAKAVAAKLGVPVRTSAVEALQDALNRAYGDVLALSAKVQLLGEDELKQTDASGRWEKPAVWVELYDRALRHYADIAARCVGLGIEAAAVSVVQAHGEQVIQLLKRVLEELGHDPGSPEVVEVVTRQVRALRSGEAA